MAIELPWFGNDCEVKVGTAVTVDTSSELWGQVNGTDYTAEIKEVNIGGGEADVSALNLLGGSQAVEEDRPGMVSVELTKAFKDRSWYEMTFGTANSSTTPTSTITSFADVTGSRPQKVIAVRSTQSGGTVTFLFNKAVVSSLPDPTITAEGHVEDSITFKSLVSESYVGDTS